MNNVVNAVGGDGTLWHNYRDKIKGRPANKMQAYHSCYPWIEFNGIWYHRSLEMVLTLLWFGESIPSFLEEQLQIVKQVNKSIETKNINFCRYGFIPSDFEIERLIALKKYSAVGIAGINVPCESWSQTIYTDCYNLGGDVLLSTDKVLKKSNIIPVICSEKVAQSCTSSVVNFDNIWVWD